MKIKQLIKEYKRRFSHIKPIIAQGREAEKIGERGTPWLSVWNLNKKKWRNQKIWYFEQIGRDGDAEMRNGRLRVPNAIQLIYLRLPYNWFIQFAYDLKKPYDFDCKNP